jgi:hypothetical protein
VWVISSDSDCLMLLLLMTSSRLMSSLLHHHRLSSCSAPRRQTFHCRRASQSAHLRGTPPRPPVTCSDHRAPCDKCDQKPEGVCIKGKRGVKREREICQMVLSASPSKTSNKFTLPRKYTWIYIARYEVYIQAQRVNCIRRTMAVNNK